MKAINKTIILCGISFNLTTEFDGYASFESVDYINPVQLKLFLDFISEHQTADELELQNVSNTPHQWGTGG